MKPDVVINPLGRAGAYRTGSLSGLTAKAIKEKLGFAANVADDPEKVKYSLGFTVNGVRCAVWSYRGSETRNEWSTFGPAHELGLVFGDHAKGGVS